MRSASDVYQNGLVFAGGVEGKISIFDVDNYEVVHRCGVHEDDINDIYYHEISNSLFTISDDRRVLQHVVNIYGENADISLKKRKTYSGGEFFRGIDFFGHISFAAVNWDRNVYFYKVNMERSEFWVDCDIQLNSVKVFEKRKQMLIGGNNGYVGLWDLEKREEIVKYVGHKSYVNYFADFAGNKILSSSDDCTCQMFDLSLENAVLRFKEHTGPIWTIRRWKTSYFLSASCDKSVKLWDIRKNDKSVHSFEGHTNFVFGVVVRDKNTFISASYDKSLILWNARKFRMEKRVNDIQALCSLHIFLPSRNSSLQLNTEEKSERIKFLRSLDVQNNSNFLDFEITFLEAPDKSPWKSLKIPSSLIKLHSNSIEDNQILIEVSGPPPKCLTTDLFFSALCGLDNFNSSANQENHYFYTLVELFDIFKKLGMICHQYVLCKKIQKISDLKGLMILFAKSIENYENTSSGIYNMSPFLIRRVEEIKSTPQKDDGEMEMDIVTPKRASNWNLENLDNSPSVEEFVDQFFSSKSFDDSSGMTFLNVLSMTIFNVLKSRENEIRSNVKYCQFLEKLNYLSVLDHYQIIPIEKHSTFESNTEIMEIMKLATEAIDRKIRKLSSSDSSSSSQKTIVSNSALIPPELPLLFTKEEGEGEEEEEEDVMILKEKSEIISKEGKILFPSSKSKKLKKLKKSSEIEETKDKVYRNSCSSFYSNYKFISINEILCFKFLFDRSVAKIFESRKYWNFMVSTESMNKEPNKNIEEIKVHKELLILRSNFFFQMFKFPGSESKAEKKIEVEFVGEQTLKHIVEFIYHKNLSSDNIKVLLEILQHSEMYFERELKQYTIERITEVLKNKKNNLELLLLENGYLLNNLPEKLQYRIVTKWCDELGKSQKVLWSLVNHSKKLDSVMKSNKEKDEIIQRLRENAIVREREEDENVSTKNKKRKIV